MAINPPLISVIMPVFNGEKFLKRAMESILSQTFLNFEFIIINDGSNDNTENIIKSFSDSRIKLHTNVSQLHLVRSLNKGLNLAQGKYIARMDSDDISLPSRFEKQVAFLEENPNVGVVGSFVKIIGSNDCFEEELRFPVENCEIKWALFFFSPLAHPAVMMRKELVIESGGYGSSAILNREKFSGEDYDLWRRLSVKADFFNIPEVLLLLRKHERNLSRIYSEELFINSKTIANFYLSGFLKKNISLETSETLLKSHLLCPTQAHRFFSLISFLYQAFVKRYNLSEKEKKNIQFDLFHRFVKQLNVGRINPFFKGLIKCFKYDFYGLTRCLILFLKNFIQKF